ncbi:addiction module antidote protein [uncultured Martelella sp.]|uniref:addiction module antidote protein n=1 Tax=uncultured Martelella sp. TaxID=392331 RepID=UPI0029C65554|nr:addiction module antidote protein [uncultured Martelella sp.]
MKLTVYDTAEYLKTEEDIIGYWRVALEEDGDDPNFIGVVLGQIARARYINALERETGLQREAIFRAFNDGEASAELVAELSKALKLDE